MDLLRELTASIAQGQQSAEYTLNVIVRQVEEEQGATPYFVAECLEIPGCVADGLTEAEAKENLEDALKECLHVLFEDCLARLTANRTVPDLRGITSQARLHVDAMPELAYA